MSNLSSVLNQLQQERRRLRSQLERLSNALSALGAIGRRQAVQRIRACAVSKLRIGLTSRGDAH